MYAERNDLTPRQTEVLLAAADGLTENDEAG
jgi:DNA-binding NarL/FixJ family response regulator